MNTKMEGGTGQARKGHLKHGAKILAELKPTQPARQQAVIEKWLVGKDGGEIHGPSQVASTLPHPGTT